MESWLKIVGFVILLIVGFKGSVAVFPYSWTHDYDGLNDFGFVVGYGGAIFVTGAVLKGLEMNRSTPSSIRENESDDF